MAEIRGIDLMVALAGINLGITAAVLVVCLSL